MRVVFCVIGALIALGFPQIAAATPSAKVVCQKMIDDGRGGSMNLTDCLCAYQVADVVLDDDIKALLFEAWFTGVGKESELAHLPNRRRIEKQFRKMERTMKKNCGLAP